MMWTVEWNVFNNLIKLFEVFSAHPIIYQNRPSSLLISFECAMSRYYAVEVFDFRFNIFKLFGIYVENLDGIVFVDEFFMMTLSIKL